MRTAFLILLFVILALFAAGLSGCTQSTITRPGPGGAKETIKSYGLTPRAGGLLEDGIRYKLRMPYREPERSGK